MADNLIEFSYVWSRCYRFSATSPWQC